MKKWIDFENVKPPLQLTENWVNFSRSGVPAEDLGASLAFYLSRCVGTQKMGKPNGGFKVADGSSCTCMDGILVFSCVTPSGRRCCHCCSLLTDTRHLLNTRLMFSQFFWWIFNWTQIIAIHNASFTKENIIPVTVYFFPFGYGT